MADKYVSADAAVQALRPGWKIVGRIPYEQEVVNPARTVPGPDGKIDPLAPATIKVPVGETLSIEGPNGEPDKMTVSVLTASSFTQPGQQSGPQISVLVGPSKGPASATGNQPSDPNKWNSVTRPGTTDVIGLWDPVNNEFHAVAGAPGAQPTGKFDPVVVTNPDGSQRQVGLVDTGDKSFKPLAAAPGAQPSGKYTNVYVTNKDGSQRLIGMTDDGDKSFHPVSADPTTQRQIVTTPTKIFVFDDAGKVVNEVAVDKNSPYQAVIIDGVPYSFDPNETDPNKRFTKAPGDWQHPPLKDAGGNPMVWDEGQGKYVHPPGVTPAATLSTVTTAPFLEWYDQQGNLIKRVENQNYRAPQTQQGVQSTTAPMIQQWNQKTGQWEWVENKGRVTASAALQNMASILSGQVVEGTISLDEAKELIAASNTSMTNAISAASNVLDYTAKGAQTGAGLLQQRAATAQGMLGTVLGLAGQGQRSGNYGGGLMSVPAGIGPMLTEGIAGYTADLMGGQGTLDAAAGMVRAAAGGDAGSPAAATAIGALTQMLDRYKQLSGTAHPVEQAFKASQQSQQQNAVVAPVASAAPEVFTAPQWARADQAQGLAPAGNELAPPGVTGTVLPGSPQYLGNAFTAPAAPQAAPTVVLNVSS
jgi:hypothetical protein